MQLYTYTSIIVLGKTPAGRQTFFSKTFFLRFLCFAFSDLRF